MLFLASPLAPSITVRHVLFGFSSDDLLSVPRVFAYLLNLSKFLVRGQRNDFHFRSKPPSAVCLLTRLKQRLRFYLPLFFKRFVSVLRCRYFARQWAANGVLGSVLGTSFALTFQRGFVGSCCLASFSLALHGHLCWLHCFSIHIGFLPTSLYPYLLVRSLLTIALLVFFIGFARSP